MMGKEPRGLGKGLSALLGDSAPMAQQLRSPVGYVNKNIAGTSTARRESSDIVRIPVGMITPNPYQPRMNFDQEALDELTASIKSLGLVQPITVRKISEGNYQIISGERRYKACCQAGMTMIPAFIREANDQGMLEMAIVENIQRENLDPIETALSYRRLIDECSLTQDQLADRLGKKRPSVANTLRLLNLPAKVQHDLKVGLISTGHAKVILGIEDENIQGQVCDAVISGDLNVRQTEDLVNDIRNGGVLPEKKPRTTKAKAALPKSWTDLGEGLGKYFKGGVSFKRSASGKGSVTIRFNSEEEVAKLLEVLENAKN